MIEGRAKNHGWCFEVKADAEGVEKPMALKGLGRFRHEAVAVDPGTGVVFLTEDRPDGLFYRFVPQVNGELSQGGRLQALALKGQPRSDFRNRGRRKDAGGAGAL